MPETLPTPLVGAAPVPAPFPTFGQAPVGFPTTGSLNVSKSKGSKRGLFGIPWLGRRGPSAPDNAPPPTSFEEDADAPLKGIRAFFERASVLIVLGLFALIGLGSGVYLTFFRPEPVVLAPRVYNIPLPTPTFEPFVPTQSTDFFAALPATNLAYGLRNAQTSFMRPVTVWPTRFAEEWLLTYDDGAGGTMTVQAVQHYTLETADKAYQSLLDSAAAESLAAQSVDPSPSASASPAASPSASASPTSVPGLETGIVRVDSIEVGQSFKVIKDITESIADPDGGEPTEVTRTVAMVTWQNGTAIFIMTADPAVIDDLFLDYGI